MKISIIIPVYNVSAYIERCLKSVMNQTYNDIECIIVDDATPDDSIVKCEQMIAAYDGPIQFSILHHQQNRGLSVARNTGTDAATGEFLYYLDSDDEMAFDCIEKLLKPICDDNSIDIVQGNHFIQEKNHRFTYNKGTLPINIFSNIDVYSHYFKYHHIVTNAWNKLIKRAFVIEYQLYFKEGLLHEDFLWMFYVLKHLERIFICKDITYIYHIRSNSITSSGKSLPLVNSYIKIFNEIFQNLSHGFSGKTELRGNLYAFCLPYCLYVKEEPAFNDVFKLYRQEARQYGSWFVYYCLGVIGAIRRVGNPLLFLKILHTIRWYLAELPDWISYRK